STYGNFRYNGLFPGAVGMDEDYDACDLENWFLALQSADGNVMIPSFHRPAVIRHDPNNPNNPASDWNRNYRYPNGFGGAPNTDSLARILRPVAADGHDATTFPDLIPDPATGKVARYVGTTKVGDGYDVDNDGDGINDSVWLDLGYPARRDSRGQLYKPLFAFMVIGLNGRIPLNTAGNLAAQDPTNGTPLHSQTEHLGNSVSEVDPTYALQNAWQGDFDPFNQLGNGRALNNYNNSGGTVTWGPSSGTFSSQVDDTTVYSANVGANVAQPTDVRLIQLRNLLAGTRPQNTPVPTTAAQF